MSSKGLPMSHSLVLGLYAHITSFTFLCGYWGSKLGPHAFTASTLQTETSPQLPKLPSLKLLIFSAPGFYITHTFGSSHFDVCTHLASSLSSVIYPIQRQFATPPHEFLSFLFLELLWRQTEHGVSLLRAQQ